MADRRFFKQGDASIQIAIEGTGVGGGAIGPDVVRSVQEISKLFGKGLGELREQRPDNLVVRFGLGVSADGHVRVTLGDTGKNFDVSMSWGSGQEATPPMPGIDNPTS